MGGLFFKISSILKSHYYSDYKKYVPLIEPDPQLIHRNIIWIITISASSSREISIKKPNSIIIVACDSKKPFIKVSARNQSERIDTAQILKDSITGIESATAGGHKAASAAKIPKKSIENFKKNLTN